MKGGAYPFSLFRLRGLLLLSATRQKAFKDFQKKERRASDINGGTHPFIF